MSGRTCSGCGVPVDEQTEGCATCTARHAMRARALRPKPDQEKLDAERQKHERLLKVLRKRRAKAEHDLARVDQTLATAVRKADAAEVMTRQQLAQAAGVARSTLYKLLEVEA